MATQIQYRRGNTANMSTFTGANGEMVVDTDKKVVVVHDGATAGGFAMAPINNPVFTGTVNAAALNVSGATSSGKITLAGNTSTFGSLMTSASELATVSAIAANGTINYDFTTQSVLYYSTNAASNWTVNFRASSGTQVNTALATGQAVSAVFAVSQGATAYFANAHQIDGVAVTPKWQGGTAPTAGNINGIDVYTYTIVKTAASTYTLLASQTQFA